MKKVFTLIAAVAALSVAVSCQKEAEEFVATGGVTVSPATLSVLPGEYKELTATVTPADATSKYITWTSSSSQVATVDGWGRVTAIAPGTATITATTASGKHTGSCKVTVKAIEATALTLDKTSVVLNLDKDVTLKATVTPANASYPTVTWTSSNEAVATVDATGKVVAVDLGTTVITATLDERNAAKLTATCTVTVEEADPTAPETFDLWKDDEAGSKKLYGPGETVDKGWIKFADGVVTWTANTTGTPRTETIELASGSKFTLTQISVDDFCGAWKLYAKLFDPNKTIGTGNVNANKAAVTITKAEGTDGNNVTVKGLYKEAAVEAKVDINYLDKTAKLGMYLSTSKIYDAGSGKYCVLLPECATTVWKDYNFCPKADKAFSDTNTDMLWFTYNFETGACKYQYVTGTGTFAGQKTANDAYQICGLSFVAASETAITGSAYDVIYQANYNGSNAESMYFSRD